MPAARRLVSGARKRTPSMIIAHKGVVKANSAERPAGR